MKPENPSFSFSKEGTLVYCWFHPSPVKKDGKTQSIIFKRECDNELEAELLLDYLQKFYWEIKKISFTDGYNSHKKREKNWML